MFRGFAYSHFFYSHFAYFRPESGVSPTCKKIIFGHQSDVELHFEVGLSLKMYLGHGIVTSCAITGFVCIKSCSKVYLPMHVNDVVATVEVKQKENKDLFIIQ